MGDKCERGRSFRDDLIFDERSGTKMIILTNEGRRMKEEGGRGKKRRRRRGKWGSGLEGCTITCFLGVGAGIWSAQAVE